MHNLDRILYLTELQMIFRRMRRDQKFYTKLMEILHEDDRQLLERIATEGTEFLVNEQRFEWPLGFFFGRLALAMKSTQRMIDGQLPDISYLMQTADRMEQENDLFT